SKNGLRSTVRPFQPRPAAVWRATATTIGLRATDWKAVGRCNGPTAERRSQADESGIHTSGAPPDVRKDVATEADELAVTTVFVQAPGAESTVAATFATTPASSGVT